MDKTLLVVDDALIIRELIKDAAQEAGWTIVGEGANGQEGYELYQEHQPTLMTMDLVMPEFDGIYGLTKILGEFPSAKILVVSALDQQDVLKQAFKIGATDFIVKPFQSEELLKALENAAALVS